MIPAFDADGLLPAGMHQATKIEVSARFGFSERRQALLAGLYRALQALKLAWCRRVYLDGSFITAKTDPNDFDACWDPAEVDYRRIDPVLYDFDAGRRAQKRKYLGELFPMHFPAGPVGMTFLEFFQSEPGTNRKKGLVVIEVEAL